MLTTGANNSSDAAQGVMLNDHQFLLELREKMLRFTILQLSDRVLAEDVVQEALVGALKNAGSFSAKAALKTWVFAILKNKIADALRQRQRLIAVEQPTDDEADEGEFSDLFNGFGVWRGPAHPIAWGSPEKSMEDAHFWRTFEACMEHLPAQLAKIFMMREFIELTTPEICAELALSETSVHVSLYRARVRLRECLENNWFERGKSCAKLS